MESLVQIVETHNLPRYKKMAYVHFLLPHTRKIKIFF